MSEGSSPPKQTGWIETATAGRVAEAVAGQLGHRVATHRVLQDSNRIVVLLEPAGVVARVHAVDRADAMQQELDVVTQLAELGAPVGLPLDTSVHVRGDFAVTLWRYYPQPEGHSHDTDAYVAALLDLHRALRVLPADGWPTIATISNEVIGALDRRPTALPETDRIFLRDAVVSLAEAVERHSAPRQLLHTQPHDKNVLYTPDGLVVIDFEGHESPRLGPLEFDLAAAPDAVAAAYPGLDADLLLTCKLFVAAHVSTWCYMSWDHSEEMRWTATTTLRLLRAHLS